MKLDPLESSFKDLELQLLKQLLKQPSAQASSARNTSWRPLPLHAGGRQWGRREALEDFGETKRSHLQLFAQPDHFAGWKLQRADASHPLPHPQSSPATATRCRWSPGISGTEPGEVYGATPSGSSRRSASGWSKWAFCCVFFWRKEEKLVGWLVEISKNYVISLDFGICFAILEADGENLGDVPGGLGEIWGLGFMKHVNISDRHAEVYNYLQHVCTWHAAFRVQVTVAPSSSLVCVAIATILSHRANAWTPGRLCI